MTDFFGSWLCIGPRCRTARVVCGIRKDVAAKLSRELRFVLNRFSHHFSRKSRTFAQMEWDVVVDTENAHGNPGIALWAFDDRAAR
jgi:hypothetical protein